MNKTLIIVLLTTMLVFSSSMFNLKALNKNQLKSLALEMDKLVKKHLGQENLIGGLPSYIHFLSKDEIIDKVLQYLSEYKEITLSSFLNVASSGEGLEISEINAHDSLKSLLEGFDKKTLKSIAKLIIKITNENHGPIMGGLSHSLIYDLSKEELIDAIDSYATAWKVDLEEVKEKIIERIKVTEKAIEKLSTLSKVQLVKLAISLEKRYREDNDIKLLGGLHDYVHSLSKERIIEEITNLTEKYEKFDGNVLLELASQ